MLSILNLGVITNIYVKIFFNLVQSFHFYGGLKLAKMHFLMDLVRRYGSLERVNFVTSRKVLVKIRLLRSTCKCIVDNVGHLHTLRSFSESKKDG